MAKQKESKYLVASVFYLIGNVVGQGIVLLSASIFTRMMSTEAYGLVNTYSAWVLILNTFIGLNLFITVRNAYVDYRDDYECYISSVMLLSLIAFAVITTLLYVGIGVLGIHVDKFVVGLAALQAISVHTINYQMAIYSMKNNYQMRTLLMILPNMCHTILSIVLVYLYKENQYLGKVIGNSVGLGLFAMIIIVSLFRKEKPRYVREYWKYALVISVPAILHTLSDLLLMQSDRIMLTELVDADATAVYSLVYNIGSIIVALYTAVNGAWTPWFFEQIKQEEPDRVRKVQSVYLLLFSFLTMAILTVSPEVIKILSPKEYWVGIDYVNLIVIASFLIFMYSFFSTYLMYHKRTGVIARNTVVVALLNILLNYFLIPKFNAVGAAIATIVSYALLFVLQMLSVRKFGMGFFCIKKMIWYIVVLILYSIVFYRIRHLWIIRYIVLIIALIGMSIWGLRYIKVNYKK